MGSKGHLPLPSHLRQPLPDPDMLHPDPFGPGIHPPPGAFPFDKLLPPEISERKFADQDVERHRLLIDNQRFAVNNSVLRQELADAQHELQRLHNLMDAMKANQEQHMRGLLDEMAKMEAELMGSETVKVEFQQAHSEAQSLVVARQELMSKVQQLTQDLQKNHRVDQQDPALISELDRLRQEYQHCKTTYDHERKLRINHYESLQVMEKNYMSMMREVEKLRAELTNYTNVDKSGVLYSNNGGYMENDTVGQRSAGQNSYDDVYGVPQVEESSKKIIAFKALSDSEESEDVSDEEMTFKSFMKKTIFLRRSSWKNIRKEKFDKEKKEDPLKCYKCNEVGHLRKNCPQRKDSSSNHKEKFDKENNEDPLKCYKCNEVGHLRKNCPQWKESSSNHKEKFDKENNEDPPKCYKCNEVGHLCKNCPLRKESSSNHKEKFDKENNEDPPKCFKCNEVGHMCKNCPLRKESSSNHKEKFDKENNEDPPKCYKCNEVGHLRKNCPLRKESSSNHKEKFDKENNEDPPKCYKCNEVGHLRKNCPLRKESSSNHKEKFDKENNEDPLKCYKCNEVGHLRKNCPLWKESSSNSKKAKRHSKKKAMKAIWGDSDASSSSSESEKKKLRSDALYRMIAMSVDRS